MFSFLLVGCGILARLETDFGVGMSYFMKMLIDLNLENYFKYATIFEFELFVRKTKENGKTTVSEWRN